MRLRVIHETTEHIRLFHGAPLEALSSILDHGLDTGKRRFPYYTEDPKVFFSFKPDEAQPASAADDYILVEVISQENSQYLGLGWAPSWQQLSRKHFRDQELDYLHPAALAKLHAIADKIKAGTDWAATLTDTDKEFMFRLEANHSKRTGEYQKRLVGPMGVPEAFIGRRIGFTGRTRIAAIYLIAGGVVSRVIKHTADPSLTVGQRVGRVS